DRARVQHELGVAITLAVLFEQILPDVLGVGEHHAYELLEIVLARRLWMLDRRTLVLRAGGRDIGALGTRLRKLNVREVILVTSPSLQDHPRVDAEEQHEPENDENADNADAAAPAAAGKADPAARHRKAEAAAFVASVLDVLAFSFAAPAHGPLTHLGSPGFSS